MISTKMTRGLRISLIIATILIISAIVVTAPKAAPNKGYAGDASNAAAIGIMGSTAEETAETAYQRKVANAIIEDASIEFIDVEATLPEGVSFDAIATLEDVAQLIAQNVPAEVSEASEDLINHANYMVDFTQKVTGQMLTEIMRAYYAFMEIDINVDDLCIVATQYVPAAIIGSFF